MDTKRFHPIHVSIFLILCTWLVSCAPAASPTPYLPPTPAHTLTMPATSTFTHPASTPTQVCFDNLSYLDDLTLPDNTVVSPGSRLDKQWLILNSGTCDWNSSYRLRFLGGSLMEATAEQTLLPARAGKEAVFRILFTAPMEAGQYVSLWQAYDPEGNPFGESFQMTIVVEP